MAGIDCMIDGGVARIVVNHPERRNAMRFAMWTALGDAVERLEADPGVRVLLLEGAGDQAFVSGADISEFATLRATPEAVAAYDAAVHRAEQALATCAKPVVARIRGFCHGGGMALAMACDLRYASETASFRMPAGRLGLGYPLPGVAQMVHGIGAARAAELFFTARTFDGREAERIGMAHRCHPADRLDEEVDRIVAAIADNAPLTLRAAKLAIRAVLAGPHAPTERQVQDAVQACFLSSDYIEGRTAFTEKRPPRFDGR
jgi:enoyl-CoA hydratase/carnithine racemase